MTKIQDDLWRKKKFCGGDLFENAKRHFLNENIPVTYYKEIKRNIFEIQKDTTYLCNSALWPPKEEDEDEDKLQLERKSNAHIQEK